ncbi:MAG: alpha-ketoglutarate-dependent dioxygenase AlkB [Deltaproteobacteria bacterium]|nr:alpha-ketoglutarate-dependent dioxygenase AlkB [Deltaproteobacteria bacterium]
MGEATFPETAPEGLRVIRSLLSLQEENSIIAEIHGLDEALWTHPQPRLALPPAKRETISFGWRYEASTRSVCEGLRMPPFLETVRERCTGVMNLNPEIFDQVIVARYDPGAGIGWHTDAPVFGPTVLSLSLGTDWHMDLNRGGHRISARVALPRRSLLVLSGAARSTWRHRLPPVRSVRYSLSFRSVVGNRKHAESQTENKET